MPSLVTSALENSHAVAFELLPLKTIFTTPTISKISMVVS